MLPEISAIFDGLVKASVQHPEAASARAFLHGDQLTVGIRTAQSDTRRIVGKEGKNIDALKTVLNEMIKGFGLEGNIATHDTGPRPPPSGTRAFSLGAYDHEKFAGLKNLLERTINPFVEDFDSLEVSVDEIGTTAIFEIKVNALDLPKIYGTPILFDHGASGIKKTDGHLIGALKRVFDGIGKNQGRVIKITLTQSMSSEATAVEHRAIQFARST